jgi:hypothetical protein
MLWAGMAGRNPDAGKAVQALVNDPRSLSLNDPEYLKGIAPIRAASGLAPLPSPPATRPAQN